jgi:hypothetical protein
VCLKNKEGATSWKALHILYNNLFSEPKNIGGWFDNLWLASPNAQAVRNRHKLATEQVFKAIEAMHAIYTDEVRILSLAAGSAEGVLKAVSMAHSQGIAVKCLLIDHSDEAMLYAKSIAEEAGIGDLVTVEVTSVTSIPRVRTFMSVYRPHIVEMMGLLVYIEDGKAISLLRSIRLGLPACGMFFTCNIIPNPEQFFLKHVLNWDMIYRTPEQLRRLFVRAGFENIEILTEAWHVHSIAIGVRLETVEEQQIPATTFAQPASVVQ